MNFQTVIDWVLARMSEPSTWRGLIGIASACGVVINPQYAAAILAGGIGLAGFINVVTKDPKNVAADVAAAVTDIVVPVSGALASDAPVANTTVN